MQTQSHRRLNLGSTITRLCLLVSCGILFTSVGCGIPGRRCAQPGNSMPSDYLWNNGAPFWKSQKAQPNPLNVITKLRANLTTRTLATQKADDPKTDDPKTDDPKTDDTETDNELEMAPPKPRFKPKDLVRPDEDTSARRSVLEQDSNVKPAAFTEPVQDEQTKEDIEKSIRDIQDDLDRGNDSLPDDDDKRRIKEIEDDVREELEDPSTEPDDSTPQSELLDEDMVDSMLSMGADANSAQLPHSAFYNDPFLLALIQATMSGNQELKILSEEIQIACNEAYSRSGEYRPFVTLGGGAGYDKVGEHTREGAVEQNLDVARGQGFPEPLGDFLVAGNLSWEIDIWKRLRNSQRAAQMQYLGTQEGRNYIVTRMVSEVAENYYELLSLDSRLVILEKTIEIQQASLEIAEGKKKAGRGTELAVQRFIAEVQKNRSEQALIQQEIVEAENRINLFGRSISSTR